MNKKKTFDIVAGDQNKIDDFEVLIFTVIEDLEAKALDAHLRRVNGQVVPSTSAEDKLGLVRWRLPCAKNNGEPIDVLTKCLKRAGNASAAIELAHLLFLQKLCRLVVFCGIGGSLDPDRAQLGNVIVGNSVHWRGFDKISGDKLSREMRKKVIDERPVNTGLLNSIDAYLRSEASRTDPTAVGLYDTSAATLSPKIQSWTRAAAREPDLAEDIENFDPSIYVDRVTPIVKQGKIVSWDFVLNQKDVRMELKNLDTDFTALEMESGGLALVARRAFESLGGIDPVVLPVRGISDLCNKKTDDFFRDLAADHAAAFVTGFLVHGYNPGF